MVVDPPPEMLTVAPEIAAPPDELVTVPVSVPVVGAGAEPTWMLPRPLGPSQPVPALQTTAGTVGRVQVPLLPEVTSK